MKQNPWNRGDWITSPERLKALAHAEDARLIKAICHEHKYIVRLSRSAIDAHGCPVCPACLYDNVWADLDLARMVEA